MRCLSCHHLSFVVICSSCKERFLKPTIRVREVEGVEVYSFYSYSTIEPLLLLKHKPQGYRVFNYLSKIILREFIREFLSNDSREMVIIGIDEKIKNGYSHIASLTHQMRSQKSHIQHTSLLSQNSITYAGKSLRYRQNNPRDFIYSGKSDIDAILVDDIITTGSTIAQAIEVLNNSSVTVEFVLVLADAKY